MKHSKVIFGLRDLPRPPKMGFFYYKLPPKSSEFHIKSAATLNLYNTDEEYLTNIFRKGIQNMLKEEHIVEDEAYLLLENHTTENIKKFAQEILKKVINEYTLKIHS
ncbi:MAG: hypothetical protein ACMUJM_00035 [bacterium]